MPDETKWTDALAKLIKKTEAGEVKWGPSPLPALIREDAVGGVIYFTAIQGRGLIVYEYTYKSYSVDVDSWIDDREVSIEFVDTAGNLQWRWPKLDQRSQLLDAIRYQLAGANEFLERFLA